MSRVPGVPRMDFVTLLEKADRNVKKSSKKLDKIDGEVSRERSKDLENIRREKIEKARREEAARQKKEDDRRAQFTIPKKKDDGPSVDKNKIAAFLAKRNEEKQASEVRRAKEKEELIKLRLAAHGGKASKKIARHFGADVIDLQVKYGQDREHIEKLYKYKEKEQEEADKLAAVYRNGVAKAFQAKVENEKKARTQETAIKARLPKKELTVVSMDGFDKNAKAKVDFSSRKRPATDALDFNALMRTAETVSKGGEVPSSSSSFQHQRDKQRPSNNVSDRPSSKSLQPSYSSHSSSKPSSSQSRPMYQPPKTQPSSKPAFKPHGLFKTGEEEERLPSGIKKPQTCIRSNEPDNRISPSEASAYSTPAPSGPTDSRGKRILPGDVRYKAWLEEQKAAGRPVPDARPTVKPSSSTPSSRGAPLSSVRNDSHREEKRPLPKMPPPSSYSSFSKHNGSSSSHSNGHTSSSRPSSSVSSSKKTSSVSSARAADEARREKMMREEARMRDEERRRREKMREREREKQWRSVEKRRESGGRGGFIKDDNSEEEEEEWSEEDDEDDLDGFIDDSGMDLDDLSRADFEETLKGINKNYDKKKWKYNEMTIDERSMTAKWKDIEKEERASARAGLKEDIREATKYRSEAL